MLESKISRNIVDKLKASGWFVTKLQTTSTPGIPDLLCIRSGRVVFIEVKQDKGIVSPLQEFRIEDLRKQGMEVRVVRDLNEIIDLLYDSHLSARQISSNNDL